MYNAMYISMTSMTVIFVYSYYIRAIMLQFPLTSATFLLSKKSFDPSSPHKNIYIFHLDTIWHIY